MHTSYVTSNGIPVIRLLLRDLSFAGPNKNKHALYDHCYYFDLKYPRRASCIGDLCNHLRLTQGNRSGGHKPYKWVNVQRATQIRVGL